MVTISSIIVNITLASIVLKVYLYGIPGFLTRFLVNHYLGVNVFVEFLNYVSFVYYLFFSGFVVFFHVVVDLVASYINSFSLSCGFLVNYVSFMRDSICKYFANLSIVRGRVSITHVIYLFKNMFSFVNCESRACLSGETILSGDVKKDSKAFSPYCYQRNDASDGGSSHNGNGYGKGKGKALNNGSGNYKDITKVHAEILDSDVKVKNHRLRHTNRVSNLRGKSETLDYYFLKDQRKVVVDNSGITPQPSRVNRAGDHISSLRNTSPDIDLSFLNNSRSVGFFKRFQLSLERKLVILKEVKGDIKQDTLNFKHKMHVHKRTLDWFRNLRHRK
jgi:hypothetical protein